MVKDILFYKNFCWINLFLIYNFWYLSKISQDLVSRFCTKRNNLVENITQIMAMKLWTVQSIGLEKNVLRNGARPF